MSGTVMLKGRGGSSLLAALALSIVAGPASGAPPASPERTYIEHRSPPGSPALPFNDAVRTGDTLYVAGHLGIDPETGNAPADPQAEARLLMDAVQRTLERAGFTMDDFVSVTVYCTDLGLYDTFNKIYAGYFHAPHPARAFIGVGKLLRGTRFEVQGVAQKTARR
jgi:2-iminobutanoate/2-iminopropanoate deaminase